MNLYYLKLLSTPTSNYRLIFHPCEQNSDFASAFAEAMADKFATPDRKEIAA
jgi:hypothetical protein